MNMGALPQTSLPDATTPEITPTKDAQDQYLDARLSMGKDITLMISATSVATRSVPRTDEGRAVPVPRTGEGRAGLGCARSVTSKIIISQSGATVAVSCRRVVADG